MESTTDDEHQIATCMNLTIGHVYEFLVVLGLTDTAKELTSLERCPEDVEVYPIKDQLIGLRKKFQSLQKNKYKNENFAQKFLTFRDAPYVYPPPAEMPPKAENEREMGRIGDADTYAKVALEIGAELNLVKSAKDHDAREAKRTIDQLRSDVDEALEENRSLNDALATKNADYKR